MPAGWVTKAVKGVKYSGKAISIAGRYFCKTSTRIGAASLRKGVVPKKYFQSKTYEEMRSILSNKFGAPRGKGKFNECYYNPKTKRSFNLHWDPSHRGGKPHIDIRKRDLPAKYYSEDPFYLKME